MFLASERNLVYILDYLQTWSVMDLWLGDTAHNNPVAAALVTWLVEKLFLYIRATLGSINIHKKTLVDSRFLL